MGLGAGQRGFEIEDGLNGCRIGEERFDGRRTEEAVQEAHA